MTYVSINGLKEKEYVVCIYIYIDLYTMEYYSAIKKQKHKIMPFTTTWMHLEGIMLSEVSLGEKDKYHMISLI